MCVCDEGEGMRDEQNSNVIVWYAWLNKTVRGSHRKISKLDLNPRHTAFQTHCIPDGTFIILHH